MRRSSPPSDTSSMVKGGTSASCSTTTFWAATSMSPVAIFGFFDSRSMTLPTTWMTHSRPTEQAAARASAGECSSTTIWVIP